MHGPRMQACIVQAILLLLMLSARPGLTIHPCMDERRLLAPPAVRAWLTTSHGRKQGVVNQLF
jgi:hypothetical protein